MRILIAYDGSECSDAAIMDLKRAGLPPTADAVMLSVAEVFPQVVDAPYAAVVGSPGWYAPVGVEGEAVNGYELTEAQSLAAQAAERLHVDFPGWKIITEAWVDGASAAIVRKAHAWQPDLLVLGSHGRSGLGRLVLGSVSKHVLHHTKCSIRISRHHLHAQERPIRVIVAVDGSEDSQNALHSAAARNWPAGAEARLIGVIDSSIPLGTAIEMGPIAMTADDGLQAGMAETLRDAAQELTESGLPAKHQILSGKPSDVLVTEAEKWSADCIFVGARGLSRIERVLLGSVSATVAAHAHCSVEIVRTQPQSLVGGRANETTAGTLHE